MPIDYFRKILCLSESPTVKEESEKQFKNGAKKSSVFFDISEAELRDFCKHQIDSFESWSRRLIDELLRDRYGADYFDYEFPVGQPLVKNEIRKRIEKRISDSPQRFPRKIDAILMEDIEYFFCRDD